MARHFMAVCVVCLLCADRLPCEQHVDALFSHQIIDQLFFNNKSYNNNKNTTLSISTNALDSQKYNANFIPSNLLHKDKRNKSKTYTATDSILITPNEEASQQFSNNFPSDQLSSHEKHDKQGRERNKRHASGCENIGHNHQEHTPKITQHFLQNIFNDYGAHNNTITLQSFQLLLRQLGLTQLIEERVLNKASPKNATQKEKACISDATLWTLVQKPETTLQQHISPNCTEDVCGNASSSNSFDNHDQVLSREDILHICPVLLYQMASNNESLRSGCIQSSLITTIEHEEDLEYPQKKGNDVVVWVYAFISVLACSILGLVGVAIIPFMDSRYYKHIIQFLVSLAVGTMTGDALLHLLPHSLAGQSEENMIYKGLTCMSGIIFFYITEHGLTMISEWRKRKAKLEINNPKWQVAKVMRDPDSSRHVASSTTTATGGDKICKSKYSSYPYCYDEIAMDMVHDVWLHLPNNAANAARNGETKPVCDACTSIHNCERKRNGKTPTTAINDSSDITAVQSLLPPAALNNYREQITDKCQNACECTHHHHLHNHKHHNHNPHCLHNIKFHNHHQQQTEWEENSMPIGDGVGVVGSVCDLGSVAAANSLKDLVKGCCACECRCTCNVDNGSGPNTDSHTEALHVSPLAVNAAAGQRDNEPVTVILREHESSHHGHSHKHGHVHSPPATLSAVAWMIIMGDGLHNFTDGMAIGAAFAENMAGGFSTALAVFCHELPHELGDFAILMKAGMSVKSAVYYNLLTGVLSFIGMIFGIVFGQSQETAQWMFAAAAGLFIYIALVDMMPEISAAHKSLYEFILQILGIGSGVLLMLIIAIYEGELMNVFPVQ